MWEKDEIKNLSYYCAVAWVSSYAFAAALSICFSWVVQEVPRKASAQD